MLGVITQEVYDQSPIARQYADGQKYTFTWSFLRARLKANGWPARCNSAVDTETKTTQQQKNEIQITWLQLCCRDRVRRADVRGCSGPGARQETQYPVHHGR